MTGRKKVVSARQVKARVQIMLRGSAQDVALNTERNRLMTMIEGMQSSNTLLEFVVDALRAKLRQDEGQPFVGFGVQVPGGAGAGSPHLPAQSQPAQGNGGQHHHAAQQSTITAAVQSEPTPVGSESQGPQSSNVELSGADQYKDSQPVASTETQTDLIQAQPAFTPPRPRRPMGGNALSAM